MARISHITSTELSQFVSFPVRSLLRIQREPMEQKKSNQERARKYGGSSSFVDSGEPSKAPRQDEDGREFIGPSDPDQTPKYNTIGEQGISNRKAEDEHAFPESDNSATELDAPDSVEATPKQQGGNRGGV